MSSPCKRLRLSADDDYDNDDDDDDRVVVACMKTDDETVEIQTQNTLMPASDNDDVKPGSMTSGLKSSVVDLTSAAQPRRRFAHTAEVIKARYMTTVTTRPKKLYCVQ